MRLRTSLLHAPPQYVSIRASGRSLFVQGFPFGCQHFASASLPLASLALEMPLIPTSQQAKSLDVCSPRKWPFSLVAETVAEVYVISKQAGLSGFGLWKAWVPGEIPNPRCEPHVSPRNCRVSALGQLRLSNGLGPHADRGQEAAGGHGRGVTEGRRSWVGFFSGGGGRKAQRTRQCRQLGVVCSSTFFLGLLTLPPPLVKLVVIGCFFLAWPFFCVLGSRKKPTFQHEIEMDPWGHSHRAGVLSVGKSGSD